MICPNCGTKCDDGTKECILCGYWLDESGSASPNATSEGSSLGAGDGAVPCPKCGNPVAAGKAFCPMCGTKIEYSGNAGSGASKSDQASQTSAAGGASENTGSTSAVNELKTTTKPAGGSKKKFGIIGGLCAAGAAAGIIIPLILINAGKNNLTLEEQLASLEAKAETASAEELADIYKEAEEIQKKLEESALASLEAEATTTSLQAETETQTQSQAATEATEATFAETSTQTRTTAATTTAFDSSKTETTTAGSASRYEAVKKDISWSDAIAECEAKGGHLATVTSQSEMDELVNLAESKGLRYVWLGGYTVVLDNNVYSYWLNDEPFSYSKWYPGEPSGTDEDGELEGALMMWRIDGEWTWNDQRDDVVNSGLDYFKGYTGYICEYD